MAATAKPHLLIFGCGYVGSAVAAEALAVGWEVTAVTRNPAKAAALAERGVRPVVADLESESWHERVPPEPEFTVNCVSSGGGGLEAYTRSYRRGMESIVRWRRGDRPGGAMVYTSSTSVYAQGGGVRVDETMPTEPETERGRILAGTEATLAAARTAWTRVFTLRLAGIYGPERTYLVEQVRRGEIAGVGDHHLNLIHRADIAAAIMACLRASPAVSGGTFNLVDDAPARKAEVVGWLAARLGVAAPRFTGEPHPGRNAVTPDRIIVNRALKAAVGWAPRYPTFREGYGTLLSH
jgi:nucleoside-diphosphate-sugar epimerase